MPRPVLTTISLTINRSVKQQNISNFQIVIIEAIRERDVLAQVKMSVAAASICFRR